MDDEERHRLKQLGILGTGVYMLHNPETTDYYIGSSENMHRRIRDHLRDLENGVHGNVRLQNAFNQSPNFQVIPVPLPDHGFALDVEDRLIKENWGNPHFLNLAKDVQKFRLGAEVSQETRNRASVSRKALYASGFVNPMLGKTHSPETVETIRQNAIRQFEDPQRRAEQSRRVKEKFEDPLHREKHSEAVRQAMSAEDVRQRTSEAATKRWENPETREKLVEAAKARSATHEGKQAASAGGKRAWENPEFRAAQCKQVSIEGVVYESMSEAARALGVGLATVNYRLNSTSERFKDWNVS